MKKKLTPKSIDALPPATGKRFEVHDTLLPGLHLRVSATGGKVFGVSRRVNGRMKRIRIGERREVRDNDSDRYPEWSRLRGFCRRGVCRHSLSVRSG